MSALSDQLVTVATFVYLIAMISHAVEYALGDAHNRSAAPQARELVGASVGAGSSAAAGLPPATAGESSAAGRIPSTPAGRARLAGLVAVGLTVLAAAAHLGAVVTRGLAAERMPWGNMYEFVLTLSFIGVVGWLAVLYKTPTLRRLGLFLTLVMVLLLGVAELVLYVEVVPLVPALKSSWFIVHVSTIVFSSALFMLGFVPAVAYLMRAGYERGKRSFPYTLARRLPSAAGLERMTFRVHAFSFPIFTFAVIAGAIWAEHSWGRPWGWDPKETWAFISWVLYAGYLHARATPSVKRNVATWISIAGFLTVLMNLFGVNIFFEGLHSYGGLD